MMMTLIQINLIPRDQRKRQRTTQKKQTNKY